MCMSMANGKKFAITHWVLWANVAGIGKIYINFCNPKNPPYQFKLLNLPWLRNMDVKFEIK